MTRQAWFCPSCQKHHAPHCDTCPGGTGGIVVSPPVTTIYPYPVPGGTGDVPRRGWFEPLVPYDPMTSVSVTVSPDPSLVSVN